MIKKTYVYDLETLDIFTATFMDKDSDETRVFVISSKRDDRQALFHFLDNEVAGLIGYNCIHFDAQILEFLYRNPDAKALQIRDYAGIITSENRQPDVPEWNLRILHLDLFRALSLSVKAKRVGLKWTEYMMNLDNIEDMPSQGEGDNWEEQVLAYNLNDVIATKELYWRYNHEIELRKVMSIKEGINLMNSTEPDIAKKLFAKYLAKEMRIPINDLRTMRTERYVVNIKDIILPYIHMTSPEMKVVYNSFKTLSVYEGDKFDKEIHFGGIPITYALGGIHGAVSNKIVESTDTHIIKSCDVVSFYPNLAIRNKFHPEHIPQDIFCNLYERLFNQRRAIPKKDPSNYVLKIILNSVYGASNDKFSYLKDRQYTLTICINGQLLLSQLFERMVLEIPDCKLIMCNTDGFEVIIPREYETQYTQICKEWEELTKLELEFIDYKKMIVSDVNNYIAVYDNGGTKCKGRYEYDNIPLHKNRSHNIIAKAVYNYFVNNTPIEDTIYSSTNIFDFCAGVKAKRSEKGGQSKFEIHSMQKGQIVKQKLSKTVRYYISKKGGYLFKIYEAGNIEHVEAPAKINRSRTKDWKITYFNKAYYPQNFSEYDIDYTYYIHKARNWIAEIDDSKQLTLFL